MATAINGANLEALLIVSYTRVLQRVRKRVRGIRISQLPAVHLLSKFPDGARGCELAKFEGVNRQDIQGRYVNVIRDGLAYKSNKRYYLTDKGRMLAVAISEEFKPELEQIVRKLSEMLAD